jgi:hypothetical protein
MTMVISMLSALQLLLLRALMANKRPPLCLILTMMIPTQIWFSQDDATSTPDSQAELLRSHHHLDHLTYVNIRLTAAKGEIPKHLAMCVEFRSVKCAYTAELPRNHGEPRPGKQDQNSHQT